MCTRPICLTSLVFLLAVMTTGVLAGLGNPPLVNPSFEDPALDPGAQSNDINGWWDAVNYTYTVDEAASGYPQTPYGDNWIELGNGRWLYQQIGTYERDMDIDISFLLGQRSGNNHVGLTVELYAGGNAQSAADVDVKRDAAGFPLDSVVGAVLIAASEQLNPFSAAGTVEAVEMKVRLSTGPGGAGYAVGDPLWLVFSRPSASGRTLIDNVVVTAVPKNMATGSQPVDGATEVPWDAVLQWTPGQFADTHDVYLGTVLQDVSSAGRTNLPIGVVLSQAQAASTYDPVRLEFGKTYYWRVDEVNAPPSGTIFPGQVWSFRTEALGYPIANVRATAASSAGDAVGPENTVDGSGLTLTTDGTDAWVHNTDAESMWQSAADGLPATIAFEFNQVYKLHEMRIWNHNTTNEGLFGLGAKEVTIEVADSNEGPWTPLVDVTLTKAPGLSGAAATDVIPMLGAVASNVRLTIRSSHGGLATAGLAEVQFFYVPVAARELTPADGTALEDVAVTLAWHSGREAEEHEVYLATEENLGLVEASDPAALVAAMPAESSHASYTVSELNLSETYFWKIVEVNEAEIPSTHASPIFSFSTPEYELVDDMETYKDVALMEIWATWLDGTEFGTNDPTNGAVVGSDPTLGIYAPAPGREGGQSLPIWFTNSATAPKSEAVHKFEPARNWTRCGIAALSLYFRGATGNTGQLYAKINGAKILYDGDATDLAMSVWHPWNIDLSKAGVDLANITSLAIGIEGSGAQGVLYIDDIRLYPMLPEKLMPTQPTGQPAVYFPFEGDYRDLSGNTRNGTPAGAPAFVAGRTGQALSLDGTRDYVTVDNWQGVLGGNPFSISLWVNTTKSDGTMVFWGTQSDTQRMEFRLSQGRFRLEHGGGNLQGNTLVADGQWHHAALVVTQDAPIQQPQVTLYLDGVNDSQKTTDADVFNIVATVPVTIGQRSTNGDRYFQGTLDEVQIFERVLSAEEVAWLAGRRTPMYKPFE